MNQNTSKPCPSEDPCVRGGLRLNVHAVQKKKDQPMTESLPPTHSRGEGSKKESTHSDTHPTAGVETISDTNGDVTNDKVTFDTKDIKQESHDSEYDQKQSTQGGMTMFLKEVNSINDKMRNRKQEIKQRMDILHKELELLKRSVHTPKMMCEYVMKQRELKELVKHSLQTGSLNFDINVLKDKIPALGSYYDDLLRAERISASRPQHEVVFVTEKTEGYRKEKEKQEKILNERKRDEKLRYKEGQPEIHPQFDYDQYYGNFDAPIPDFCQQGINAYNYPSRGMYEYENYQMSPYDNFGEFFYNQDGNGALPLAIPDEKEGDQRMLYPSQNPALAHSNHLNNKIEKELANKNKDGDLELVDKAPENAVTPFDDFNDEFLHNNDMGAPLIVKREIDEEDLFESDAEILKNPITTKKNDFDDTEFGDPFSNNDGEDLSGEGDDESSEEYNDDENDNPNHSKEMDNQMPGHLNISNPNYMYMDPNDPMNAQAYGQGAYMMDPRMNGAMYGDSMYPPSHALLHMPYLKAEGDMNGYMQMNHPGAEYDYYGGYGHMKHETPKSSKTSGKGRKRNKYKMLPSDLKHKAVDLAACKSPKFAANFYSVPLKSLKRWIKVGCERKKGGGRKTKDPIMEKNLYAWYVERKTRGELITAKMIKEKAIDLTNCSDFIASKGWLDKFKVRYNLEISKETCKDGHRRRVNTDVSRKRGSSIMNYPQEDEYMGLDMPQYQSCRRSLNKSVKREPSNSHVKNEIGSVFGRDGNGQWIRHIQDNNIKAEEWSDRRPEGNARNTKSSIPSIFSSIPTHAQLRTSRLIEKPKSGVKHLPVCDADHSGD